eukprot:7922513-Ditylum_brightwellii.AAC.1
MEHAKNSLLSHTFGAKSDIDTSTDMVESDIGSSSDITSLIQRLASAARSVQKLGTPSRETTDKEAEDNETPDNFRFSLNY